MCFCFCFFSQWATWYWINYGYRNYLIIYNRKHSQNLKINHNLQWWSKATKMKWCGYKWKLLYLCPNTQMRKFKAPGEGEDLPSDKLFISLWLQLASVTVPFIGLFWEIQELLPIKCSNESLKLFQTMTKKNHVIQFRSGSILDPLTFYRSHRIHFKTLWPRWSFMFYEFRTFFLISNMTKASWLANIILTSDLELHSVSDFSMG